MQPQSAARSRQARRLPWSAQGLAGWLRRQQLARAGHAVTVFEKNRPHRRACCVTASQTSNWKKHHIDQRMAQMQAEGVRLKRVCSWRQIPGQQNHHNDARRTISAQALQEQFDASQLCGGAEQSRDLPVPGRDMGGVHFAMEFYRKTRSTQGDKLKAQIRARANTSSSLAGRHRQRLRGHQPAPRRCQRHAV